MSRAGDMGLGACGLGLAALAAWFPWHVYFSPESYGPPRMTFERVGDPVAEHMAALDALLERSVRNAPLALSGNVDRTITGSISGGDEDKGGERVPLEPQIVFGVPGRALVRHNGEMILWQAGSRLGDGRVVVSISEAPEGIEIRLSDESSITQARGKVEEERPVSRK